MKKSNKIILGALAAIFVFTIAFQLNVNRYLRSSEPKKETDASISEERTVANFNKIFVSHSIEVYFTQDSIASVTIHLASGFVGNGFVKNSLYKFLLISQL